MTKGMGNYFLGDGCFELREMTLPDPGTRDVLVRVRAAGVCGTDVHIARGEKGSAEVHPPVVLGHEYAGDVVAVGSGVTTLRVGDRVTVDPNIYCGGCDACRTGKKQFCHHLEALGVTRDGGFAEYCRVPEGQAFVMNESITYEEMAMTEPVACCMRGMERAQLCPGDDVLIVGGGAIGQIMAQLAHVSGAARVFVSEPSASRRELALSLGVAGVIDPVGGDPLAAWRDLTGKPGADVVIECAGVPAASRQAVALAASGARVVFFGVPAPDAELTLPMFDIYKKELRISGSFINPNTHMAAAALINAGRLRLLPLITHRFPLADVHKAVETQRDPRAVKVMVMP